MSYSQKLSFSVAKFAIEGVGQGAVQSTCSVPPRLPGSQTSLTASSELSFPSNPFSLLRSSSSKSHVQITVPQSSALNVHSCVSANQSAPFLSPPLFPNPFLIKQTLDVQLPINTSFSKSLAIVSPSSLSPTTAAQPAHSSTTSSTPSHPVTTNPFTSTRKPRKPRPDRILTPSSFRPRVMAVDRLFSWHTPFGISHDESLLAQLPPALVESAKMSITGALAVSSQSTYAAGLLRFNQFCNRWEISEDARMPASYALLCAFIGNYKGTTSGKTIKSWLSGIRAWHLINHAPWYGDDKWVQMARVSANKEGSRHKRALRAPVSTEHLLALRRAIQLSNNFHAAIWAVALVTFFGCRRLGEITVGTISSFDPAFHVLRSAEYDCFYLNLSFSNLVSLVSILPLYEMAHVRPLSAYPGQKLLVKKARP